MIGTFSLGAALVQFVYVAVVGIAVGIAGGLLIAPRDALHLRARLTDDVIIVTITLVTPFLVYLAADRLGASGVLACAAGGMYLSRKGGGMYTPEARLIGAGVWNMLFFVFNGALFIILGLQLRAIVARTGDLPGRSAARSMRWPLPATVIAVRLIWVPILAWLRRKLDRRASRARRARPPLSWTFILGWAGMRGIVSLAAALSIPDISALAGAPFPARDLILFITFAVILVTLARSRADAAVVDLRGCGSSIPTTAIGHAHGDSARA